MCIRDRGLLDLLAANQIDYTRFFRKLCAAAGDPAGQAGLCLLYTSDAADERSSVDLGGRRIIKKKK